MNERGVSFIETVLALSILFLLTLTIIPLAYKMQMDVEKQKAAYYASEVAYNGALLVKQYGVTYGTQQLGHILYEWAYDAGTICTNYHLGDEVIEQCIM